FWGDLANTDAAKGQAAIWALASSPRDSVPFLANTMRAATPLNKEKFASWIADLDSVVFTDREKASRELERQVDLAEPLLRKALAGDPSPEVRRRIEALLNKARGPVTSADALRTIRAIETLEHIATPEARQLLAKLAEGAPGDRQTQEAKAALERLAR